MTRFLSAILLLLPSLALGYEAASGNKTASGNGAVSHNKAGEWQFEIKPVIWNSEISLVFSDSNNDGGDEVIEPSYCFFCLDKLSAYLAVQAEARKQGFALLFDGLRVRFEDTPVDGPASLTLDSTLGFVELAAAYRHLPSLPLDAYIGVRHTIVENEVRFRRLPSVQSDFDWTDPIVGARYRHALGDDWAVVLRGDLGGFGVDTDLMINASLDVEYRFNPLFALSAGYRYLDFDFDSEDDFLLEARLQGLQIAASFRF